MSRVLSVGAALAMFVLVLFLLGKRQRSREQMAFEHLQSAQQLQKNGNLVAAQSEYAHALAIDSTRPDVLNNLASLYVARGQYDSSIMIYKQALARDSNYALAYGNLGTAYLHRGDSAEAARAFTAYLQRQPNPSDPLAAEIIQARKAQVAATIDAWAKAWERTAALHSVEEYERFYAPDFTSDIEMMGGRRWDLAGWMADKLAKAKQKQWIRVEVANLSVDIRGDQAEARFCQLYQSNDHADQGNKRMTLRLEGARWLITHESWTFRRCKP